jgi:prenylcysteine oxidase / farnesylcysteine lyase
MFLRDFFQNEIHLKIFEKMDRLGGRTFSIPLPNGDIIDIGGTSIVEENRYAMEFKDKFDMDFANESETFLNIWDNKIGKFVFQESMGFLSEFRNIVNVLISYQYGPFQTKNAINEQVWKIIKIYHQQDDLKTWNSPFEMFKSVGMHDLFEKTFHDYFLKSGKIHKKFADDLVIPICLVNYLQNSSISAMGGLISSVALISDFHKFELGADGFSKNLAKNSSAEIHLNTSIVSIQKDTIGIILGSKSCDDCDVEYQVFDKVVLGTSIELSNIEFIGFDFKVKHLLKYRQTHVTILRGKLKAELFGLDPKFPHEIIYNENENPDFLSIQVLKIVNDSFYYKIFSSSERDDNFIEKYFRNVDWKFKHSFLAYPMLTTINEDQIQPAKLDDNLYYVNSMESVISTMETEMISSKNVAMMLAKDWYQYKE